MISPSGMWLLEDRLVYSMIDRQAVRERVVAHELQPDTNRRGRRMNSVKWMALNWPWVIIALGIIVAFLVWGKQQVSRSLEIRHERKIAEIKTQAAQLPFGNSLSEAEKTIQLNRGIEVLEKMVDEAEASPLVSITLQQQIKEAKSYMAHIKEST